MIQLGPATQRNATQSPYLHDVFELLYMLVVHSSYLLHAICVVTAKPTSIFLYLTARVRHLNPSCFSSPSTTPSDSHTPVVPLRQFPALASPSLFLRGKMLRRHNLGAGTAPRLQTPTTPPSASDAISPPSASPINPLPSPN